jgi:putative transposase
MSIVRQCELMNVTRSCYYYQPKPVSEVDLHLMKLIDRQYLITPFYGSRRMTQYLKANGENANRKRVQRLMKEMSIETMYPKRRTSISNRKDYKYPYLLKEQTLIKPNQAWGTDITFIPTVEGYLYLVAILDLFSRYVLSWVLSDTMEVDFCIYAIEQALKTGMSPEIINSDQGSQYTSKVWIDILKRNKISISMTGKGKCWDNIFVERLWRSLKYEEVYPKGYMNVKDAKEGIDWYFNFYNNDRLHEKLSYRTPKAIHFNYEGKNNENLLLKNSI